jgi:hypothetical protein
MFKQVLMCWCCRPFKLVRLCMSILFHIFYICLLNYFLTPLSCQFLSKDPTKKNHLVDFPTQGNGKHTPGFRKPWSTSKHKASCMDKRAQYSS